MTPNFALTVKRYGLVALTATACMLFPARAQAPLDLRVALVIGNSAYPEAPLFNPGNDARAMSETLRRLGFTVVELRDADRNQMTQAVGKVRDALQDKQGVGMMYYSGHGLQLDWRNYMVPVDAKLSSAADVPAQTVDVNTVLESFRLAGTRMNILVMDACRENPFAGSAASGKGLAQLDAPPGTFLAYATAPGNVAADGDGSNANGVYTHYLLQELQKPTSRIEDVFKRVRMNVRKQSQGRQIPWESTSLEDEFYFNTGQTVKPLKADEKSREAEFARQKTEWDKIKESTSADAFYAFLNQYPNGFISEQASAKIEQLQKAQTVAVPDSTGHIQTGFLDRYRHGDIYHVVFKDGLTGVEKRRSQMTIQQLAEDDFEARVGDTPWARITRAGFISMDGRGTYDPPYASVPGSILQVGKKWESRSILTSPKGQKQWVDIDARIAAREKITVPLGTFDTYRVEVHMTYQDGGRTRVTFWFEPEWGVATKFVREFRARGANAPDILIREVVSRTRIG